MASVDEKWFKDQLALRGISIRELGRRMGLDHSAIVLTFKGRRRMKFEEAAGMARLIGITVSQVLEHAGMPMAPDRLVPITGYVDSHGELHLDYEHPIGHVPAPDLPAGATAVQFRTAASPFEMFDGWLAFGVCTKDLGVLPQHIGRLCFLRMQNGPMVIGYLRRGYQRGRFNVELLGMVSMDDVIVEWSVPVLMMRPAE